MKFEFYSELIKGNVSYEEFCIWIDEYGNQSYDAGYQDGYQECVNNGGV